MARNEEKRAEYTTIPREDLFTRDLQYQALIYPLTGIHWQILNGWNANQLLLGGVIGLVVTEGVSLVAGLASGMPLDNKSFNELWIGGVVLTVLFISGRIFDSKRGRLIKSINEKLLSDEEIGL